MFDFFVFNLFTIALATVIIIILPFYILEIEKVNKALKDKRE